MSEPHLTYYFDSSVFIAFFNDEEGRADAVESLLEEAHDGNISIVTSSFSLVEVIKMRGSRKLEPRDEKMLGEFFEYSFIRLVDATRKICEDARMLIWKHSHLAPKDSVHLASALEFNSREALDGLFSFDTDFTKLNRIASNAFEITEPFINQRKLPLIEGAPRSISKSEDARDE